MLIGSIYGRASGGWLPELFPWLFRDGNDGVLAEMSGQGLVVGFVAWSGDGLGRRFGARPQAMPAIALWGRIRVISSLVLSRLFAGVFPDVFVGKLVSAFSTASVMIWAGGLEPGLGHSRIWRRFQWSKSSRDRTKGV